MDQQQLDLATQTLREIAIFANHPLKRLLPTDTWIALQIGDEDLVSISFGLTRIVQSVGGKKKITPSNISSKNVRAVIQFIIKQAGKGDVTDDDADALIAAAKAGNP